MTITRNNYESYFLLYIDNELDAAGRIDVEDFVRMNPDLRMELDALQQTIFPAEAIAFPGKENLLRKEVPAELEEKILLMIDDELHVSEVRFLQQTIRSTPALQQEYESLSLAKLDNSEIIPFPDKTILYKHSQPSVILLYFRRFAVAAMIAGILFGVYILMNSDNSNEPVAVTVHSPLKQPSNLTPAVPVVTIPANQNTESASVNTIASSKEIKQQVKNTTIEKELPVLAKSLVSPENENNQEINNNTSNKPVELAVHNKSDKDVQFKPELLTIANGKPEPVLMDKDLIKGDTPDVALASFNQEPASEDKVLYMDEERVARSKIGILFKQVKRVVERNAKIKRSKGLHIGGFDIAVK